MIKNQQFLQIQCLNFQMTSQIDRAISFGKGVHVFFIYKNTVYKNIEAEIWPKIKNTVRTCPGSESIYNN